MDADKPETSYTKSRDKRQWPRVKGSFVTRMREKGGESRKWELVTLRDLGAGGISFLLDRPFSQGAVIDMDIALPGRHGNNVHCRGEVMRVENPGRGPLNRIAAALTDISSEDKEFLEAFVRQRA
ncbi:MAG: PilZ domain-containing protein [Candidatus Omnitrophica bacterium]|nr:PilZ domain-containing protein [Candidatus Omnitrophota bacterium]MDD5488548.1 PilZ domain-containing protein [Candidatus Omnitrophota bacterium]